MRILMQSVHFDLPGDTIPIGGVQKHIKKVTDELKKHGHEVEWKYPADIKNYENYDIAIFHDFSAYDFKCQIPKIIVFHGWEGVYPIPPDIYKQRKAIKDDADYVITVGEFINKYYDVQSDLTIYGGTEESANESVKPIQNKAVYVGRLEADNQPFQALAFAKSHGWDVDVCGDGSLRCELEKQFPDMNFHGFVEDTIPYIQSAEYVLIGGYLSMLDAMICQKPVFGFYGNNTMRHDYLRLLPDGVKVFIFKDSDYTAFKRNWIQDIVNKNHEWAKEQTWDKIARHYIQANDLIKNQNS